MKLFIAFGIILVFVFDVDHFFSLHGFAHASLWNGKERVWDALFYLDPYLKSFSHKIEISIPEGVFLENKESISIGKGTTIDPGVLIQGPCVIGKNCRIRHGAFLRGSVILGDDCVVGHGSELKNAILLNGSCAAHLCYVGDSILGSNVNLSAGVKCANLRLDAKEVSIVFEGKKIKTGLKKLGAILGSDVKVGCNCVLNPGTLIGKKSAVYPLLNIGGCIPAFSEVKAKIGWVVEPKMEKVLQHLISSESIKTP